MRFEVLIVTLDGHINHQKKFTYFLKVAKGKGIAGPHE